MKFKLGERVTIEVNRRGDQKQKKRAASPEVHYGPIVRIEDPADTPTRARLSVAMLDMSTVFIQRPVNDNRKVLFYTQLYGNVAGDEGTPDQSPLKQSREDLETGAGSDTLGAASLDPNAVAVADSTHGEYRSAFNRWPLPFLNTSAYGLSLTVGDRTFLLSDDTPEWVEREITNEVELDEQAAPWSSSSPSDTTSISNLWHDFFPDWWRNYARLEFKPARARSRWSVSSQTDLPCFEDFDPFDLDNFKIMIGDEEVNAPLLDVRGRGKKLAQIGLVPRFWTYSIEFTEWGIYLFDGVIGPFVYKRTGSIDGEMLGITSPWVSEYDIDHEPLNQVEFNQGTYQIGHTTTVNTFTANIDGLPPQQTPFGSGSPDYTDSHTNFLMYMLSVILVRDASNAVYSGPYPVPEAGLDFIERSDCTLTLTVAETPVEALAGKVRHRAKTFNIYRRTTNPGGQEVYSGPFDSLGITNGVNSFYNSFARDFADYDPDSLATHITI